MTTGYSRVELIGHVSEATARWYERSARRLTGIANSSEGAAAQDGHELSFSWLVREKSELATPAIRVRERLHTRDNDFEGSFELEVVFGLGDDFPVKSDAVVRAFIEEFAFEYVLGMIRAVHYDMARAMGVTAGLIPAFDVRVLVEQSEGPSEED